MNAFVEDLNKKYPEMTKIISIGKSIGGKNLFGIIVHAPNFNPKKKAVHISGLTHAREFISGMVAQYVPYKLLNDYPTNPKVKKILNALNIIVIPSINPDGYTYAFTTNRMWRKNRNPNTGGCIGVDLMRNYPEGYGVGASSSECAETYKGISPLSEAESKAMSAHLDNYPFVMGIDFHSYSQMVLRPWGYKQDLCPGEQKLKKIGQTYVDKILETSKEKYQNIRGVELYPAGGGLDDYMYTKGLDGFCMELRDTGRFGFLLPESQILPTCEENYAALVEVWDKYYSN
jgi:murein tripeptide amidase MpaA